MLLCVLLHHNRNSPGLHTIALSSDGISQMQFVITHLPDETRGVKSTAISMCIKFSV